ncbi:MAG: helix-turn-helix domain-containing protein [Dehalococcoidia bacterium]|nr:helix-turn-helix domain-containing protein [Dehalococcoidia bacterium]
MTTDESRTRADTARPSAKVHIARLRQQLGDHAHTPRHIFTDRGLGYRFVRPATVPFSPHSSA